MIAFAALYDPQSFHIDVEAAKASPYGGLIASGFQTLAIGFRLFLDTAVLAGTSFGSNAVDELRWLKPVRPGDTLHTVARVIEARPSASKPDRGIVRASFRVLNERDEDVLTFLTTVFVARRPN
jgi:acyl dehydratase